MTEQEIEFCLERLATCKTTDIMNFDYAGTLSYIQRLKAENAALKERLDKAVELPFLIQDGEEIIVVYKDKDNYIKWYRWIEYKTYGEYGNGKEVAEARLKELQGGNI